MEIERCVSHESGVQIGDIVSEAFKRWADSADPIVHENMRKMRLLADEKMKNFEAHINQRLENVPGLHEMKGQMDQVTRAMSNLSTEHDGTKMTVRQLTNQWINFAKKWKATKK